MAITWSGWSNYLNARGENGWGMRFAYGYEISRRASDNHVLVNFYVAETTTNCYIYDAVRSVYASIWYSSNDKIGVSFSWGGSSTPLGTSNYNGGTIPNVGGTWPQTRQPVYSADAVYLHTYDVGNLDNAGTVTFTRDIDGGMGPYFGVSGSYNLDGYCQAPKIGSVATPDRITTPPLCGLQTQADSTRGLRTYTCTTRQESQERQRQSPYTIQAESRRPSRLSPNAGLLSNREEV